MSPNTALDHPQTGSSSNSGKLDYIDAVRGWAILLVMISHVGQRFAELPYPLKKLTNFGWHGVQLFFLASAVTLTMSWHRQSTTGWLAGQNFFIRRFLRIAPMYYFGALLYFLIDPPASGFDGWQLARSFLFVNAWHPDWIPTTPGWMVVPGGWSIGVEFTFYFVFPLLVSAITGWRRAIFAIAISLGVALAANWLGSQWLSDVEPVALDNFLYFWFPNQFPVFLLGMALYFAITKIDYRFTSRMLHYGLICGALLTCAVAAENPPKFGHSQFTSIAILPLAYTAAICFAIFIFVLAKSGKTIFVNAAIRRLGVLSFSSYVLHFIFVRHIPDWSGGIIDVNATGYTAIAMCGVLWVATIAATMIAASVAHALLEQPAIELARRLTASARRRAPQTIVTVAET